MLVEHSTKANVILNLGCCLLVSFVNSKTKTLTCWLNFCKSLSRVRVWLKGISEGAGGGGGGEDGAERGKVISF